MRKSLVLLFMVLFTLSLTPLALATPRVPPEERIPNKTFDQLPEVVLENIRIRSALKANEISSDLPMLTDLLQVQAVMTTPNGKEAPVNYRAKHSVEAIEDYEDYSEYFVTVQFEAPIEIMAYQEYTDQKSESLPVTAANQQITAHCTVKFKYRIPWGSPERYYQWQEITTWWTRTNTSYSITRV